MGHSFEFYTGDSRKIRAAFIEDEIEPYSSPIDLLDEPGVVQVQADLSFHLEPQDLNLLSLQFGKYSGRPPVPLRPYLSWILDESDHGLLLVADRWVEYAAAVRAEDIPAIVEAWFQSMRDEYQDDGIQVSPPVIQAVRDLVELCRYARQKKTRVYHAWQA